MRPESAYTHPRLPEVGAMPAQLALWPISRTLRGSGWSRGRMRRELVI